jgi:hypothetical protein
MKKLCVTFLVLALCAFSSPATLKGTWVFVGGVYNGKKEGAPTEYDLHRKYSEAHYEAFAIEKGSKPQKYETGNYVLAGDTCTDTETWCGQPSKITNIPVHYLYSLKNDTLTLKGVLPTGMQVEEYWKKLK